jgi:deoxyribodipyrimidine photo-lyase
VVSAVHHLQKKNIVNTVIWWLRRDLRLTDNQALTYALAHAEQVIPVFVFDPSLLNSPYSSAKRLAFLLEGLRQLAADLQARGSYLIIRQGRPIDELAKLMTESRVEAIFAEADYSPYARRRDDHIIASHLPLQLVDGLTVHPPTAVLKADKTPYTVYTPFSRAWKALSIPQANAVLPAPSFIPTPPELTSIPLPTEPRLPDTVPFIPGEAEAHRLLNRFAGQFSSTTSQIEGDDYPIFSYADSRNRMDLAGTSQLSPYLRFGMLSARQAVATALEAVEVTPNARARSGATTWLNELIWREFYISILYHFPHVRQRSFRPNYDDIPWDNDLEAFAAWCEGLTGYPVVDAAMRELVQSGWMHNRARMIVASFLVKDLLIDWRWGERFFMQHLIDGDPAANNGGWQWAAGTGTDAAPYFRIFNPVLQGQKFDPAGAYVRRWVPELMSVPDKYIHSPWKIPDHLQHQAGCRIGQDYPAPVVDHKWARARTLAAYKQSRKGD